MAIAKLEKHNAINSHREGEYLYDDIGDKLNDVIELVNKLETALLLQDSVFRNIRPLIDVLVKKQLETLDAESNNENH